MKNRFLWFCWLPACLTEEMSFQKEFMEGQESLQASRDGFPWRIAPAQCRRYGKIGLALLGAWFIGTVQEVGIDEVSQGLQWAVCKYCNEQFCVYNSSVTNMPRERKEQFCSQCSVAPVIKWCKKLEMKIPVSSPPPTKGCFLCYIW